MVSSGTEQSEATNGWRAPALDVHGPAGHGRRGPGRDGVAEQGGDRGTLWIAGATLCFGGRRDQWSVPLGWLDTPQTDLAGTTHLPVRSADRLRPISFRLARGAADSAGLVAAIKQARIAEPDARDRAALQELLGLVAPELQALQSADDGSSEPYSSRASAAAGRLQSAWLSSWGVPATRLRDASAGMLTAAAEASTPADADAGTRFEQAVARWRNVCEDLRDWCNVPDVMDLHAPVFSEGGGVTPDAVVSPAARRVEPPAPAPAPPPAPPAARREPPAPAVAAELVTAPPKAAPPPAPQPAARQAPPPPRQAPPRPPEDDDHTVIAAREYTPPQPAPPPAAPPPPPAPAPSWDATVRRAPAPATDDEDMTVIVSQPPAQAPVAQVPQPGYEELPTAAELNEDATVVSTSSAFGGAAGQAQSYGAQPVPQSSPVVSGPGRPGSGGMTMLYRRSGHGPTGSVARKELQSDDARTPSVVQSFLDIGHRFRAVRHPNAVRILDVGIDPESNAPFIEMEFVEGESVSARQRRGPMPADQALDLIEQLAAAIDAVHATGLIHGDLRPQNVLLEPGGRTVLLEPSVACEYSLEHNRGTIYGELPYLTPERVSGEASVANSDIYALGTLAYALLAGRPPFNGEPAEIFAGHAEEQPPPLDEALPGAPRAASVVIARTLAKNPYDRPSSATTFAADLRAALSAPVAAPPQRAPAPSWPAPQQEAEPPKPSVWGQAAPPQQPQQPPPPQQPPAPQRGAPGPLGRGAPGPLGGGAPGPLGRRPPPDDEPPDDMDRTVIVRPPQ